MQTSDSPSRSLLLVGVLVGLLVLGLAWWLLSGPDGGQEQQGLNSETTAPIEPGRREVAHREAVHELLPVRTADEEPENQAKAVERPTSRAQKPPENEPVELGPAFVIHVLDKQTLSALSGVELVCIPDVFARSDWRVPGSEDPYTSLGRDLVSPVTLRFSRQREDEEKFASGFQVQGTSQRSPQTVRMAEVAYLPRGLTFFARAKGYAWGVAQIDVKSEGERRILLEPDAGVHLRLINAQPEAYAGLDESVALYVFATPEDGQRQTVWIEKVDQEMASEGLELSGVLPGRYRASVEIGDSFDRNPRPVLGEIRFDVSSGQRREEILRLDDPPEILPRVQMGGTLSFPDFDDRETILLRLYNKDTYEQGPPDQEIPIAEMTELGGVNRRYAWDAGLLRPGEYQAKVWPFLVSFSVTLPPAGSQDIALAIDDLAEVSVETVDQRDGKTVPTDGLFLYIPAAIEGQVNHVGSMIDPITPGTFRFFVVPSEIDIRAKDTVRNLGFTTRGQRIEAVSGKQHVRLELAPYCALKVLFKVGESLLPISSEVYDGLSQAIRSVDGKGSVTHDRTRTEKSVEFDRPGLYDISFDYLPDEFDRVPERRVQILAGETAEIVVELRHR